MDAEIVRNRTAHAAASKLRRSIAQVAAMVACLGCCAGCYDTDALIKRASSSALRATLAEVDLGSFHTTLPRDTETKSLTEIRLHVFAAVPRYHAAELEELLEAEAFRLRHELLAVVRNSTAAEFAEPSLGRLRRRLQGVVNDMLEKSPVKFVGFYDFALRRT